VTDQEYVIELDDTEGHSTHRGIVETQDPEWLRGRLGGDTGTKQFRRRPDDSGDTEGSELRTASVVRVIVDDDDVEGHAISIHFPSRAEADAFRRRLLVTGVLVGTVALGAAGGAGLSALQSDDGSAGALTSQANEGSTTRLNEMAATTQAGAANLGNPAGLNEMAATTQAGAANQGNTERLNEMAATTQSGAASSAASSQAWQEASSAEAARQGATNESAASQAWQEASSAEAARQGGVTSNDNDDSERNDIGGPTPR